MVLFPIGDDNRDRKRLPIVTFALIAANVFVFVVLQQMGANLAFTYAFATVPAEIVSGQDLVTPDQQIQLPEPGGVVVAPGLRPTPGSVYFTLLTSMFMHGGLMHLAGNMLFLWIFGDNVEDDLGRIRYLGFYLATGLVASLAHVALNTQGPSAQIPSLGASGAISGVLAGYLLLHPYRRVRVILFRAITDVPAIVAIGMWFVFQLINGMAAAGSTGGGVAYSAHIGGFVAGLILVRVFGGQRDPPRVRPA
jgi:membrane associated rhomboid family serine protease